jgi:hypothetical protein
MTKSQWKAEKDHLEEGKAARPIKDMKTAKLWKEKEKLKISTSTESIPPNTLNASSPP